MAGLVTLITDASYDRCGDRHFAGWGAWAKGDEGSSPHRWSGPAVGAESSASAELVATYEGFVRVRCLWPKHAVLLQSDCMRALMLLRWRFGFPSKRHRDGLEVNYKQDMRPTDLEAEILSRWAEAWHHQGLVMLRHVKGHTGRSGDTNGGRYWVNREVDRLARDAMRLQRTGARDERPEAGADR